MKVVMRPTLVRNVIVKTARFACFVIALLIPPDVIEGKGLPARAPLFLAPAIVTPIVGRLRRWRGFSAAWWASI